MKKLVLLVVLLAVVASLTGCKTTAHAFGRDCQYLVDDSIRFMGLDQPDALHPRDLVPWDAYEPYRGYP